MWETIRYRRLQALTILALAALVTACAVFTPLYDRATQQALTRVELEHATVAERGLQVSSATGIDAETRALVQPPAPRDVGAVVPRALRRYFEPPILQNEAPAQPVLDRPSTAPNGLLVSRSGACAHLRISSGRCPTGADEVVVSRADSHRYGASVGSTLEIPGGRGLDLSRPLTLRVVGVYRQVPGAYWSGFRLTDRAPSDPRRPDQPEHDVWLTDASTFSADPSLFRERRSEADFLLRVDAVGVDQADELRRRIDALRRTVASHHDLAQYRIASGLGTVAADVAHQRAQSRVTVPLLMAQLGVLAVVVLWLVLSAATEQRRPEIAVAMLRGRGRRGARRLLLRELLPVTLAGVPVGAALALLLCWAARSLLLPGSAPFEIRWPAVLTTVGVALLLAAVALVAVTAVARQPVERLLRRVPERRAGWSFGALEALLLAVAATAVVAFVTGGLTGPIAWVAPTLLALVVGILLAHATTPVCAALGHRLLRRRRVAWGVSLLEASRSPAARRTIAMVTVATSLLVFVCCTVLVGARNRRLAADQTAGAAVTVEVGGDDLAAVRSAVRAVDPHRRRLTTVLTVIPPSSGARETVAVDPSAFGRIAVTSDPRLTTALRRLATPDAASIELRGDALAVTVRTTGLASRLADRPNEPPPPADLQLDLVDAENRMVDVPLGRLHRGSSSRSVRRSIDCSRTCHLVGITVRTTPTALVSGRVELAGLATTAGGTDPTPVALGAHGAWTGRHGSGGTMVPFSADGSDLSIAVDTAGLESTTMRQAWLPETVPVVVTRGRPRTVVGLDGEDRPARVVGQVPRVPRAGPNAALADLDTLARGTQLDGTNVIEIWLDRDDQHLQSRLSSALSRHGLRIVGRTSLTQVRQRLDDSIAAWSLALGVVVGVAAMLLGVLVVLVLAVTTWRSRSRDLAALRLAGVAGPTTRRVATLAQVPALVVAVLAGAVCGGVGRAPDPPDAPPLRSPARGLHARPRSPVGGCGPGDGFGPPPATGRRRARRLRCRASRGPAESEGDAVIQDHVAPRGLSVSTHGLVHLYHSEGHDVAALSGVDLVVRSGELVGLLGPSGAGKSTLLSLLGGLFRPSAGKIRVGDVELSNVTPAQLDDLRARDVALMLQGAARNLLPYYTARQNVAFAQAAARRYGKDLPDPVEVLEQVGLDAREIDRPLSTLTPGHLQLAAVAATVSTRPGVLLADEPTSQLDHEARDLVLDRIGWINRVYGTTVLLVTHDPEVAAALPRTVTIRDGRIGGEGRSGEEYSVVTADGFLPLPTHVRDELTPGTLVRFHRETDDLPYTLMPEDES